MNELERWKSYLREYHYLDYRWMAGKSLHYVATLTRRWVAIVGWGSTTLKCGARDDYIG